MRCSFQFDVCVCGDCKGDVNMDKRWFCWSKKCRIDPTLIIALVKQWRLETHTFHLSWGECTITLKDVALHLGIRVDDRVVTGPSFLHWDELCDELLREVPPKNARKGAALKMTWLLSILCAPLSEEPTIHQLQCRCRAYIMYMIDDSLIPDKSGNRVHLMYLNLLHDLNNIKKYSWDSTCLANLYKELCRASSEVGRVMSVMGLVPHAFYCTKSPHKELLISSTWIGGRLEYRVTPHDDLVPYRGFEEHLPRHVYRDREIWSACTAIICFPIVEWHQTNRVKLQFGLQQHIPIDSVNLDRFHQIDMQDNHYSDWMKYHTEWINIWKTKAMMF
ncbi:Serine/threonine-protein phosphatase 7 long form [Glycine soja]